MSNLSTLTEPPATAAKPTYELNTTHRCDRCGAQAWVRVRLRASDRLPEGGELLFCGHDYNTVELALMPYLEGEPLDERHRLVQNKLKGSANS